MKNQVKTVVVSNLNIGNKESHITELITFLNQIRCENLILLGETISREKNQAESGIRKGYKFLNKLIGQLTHVFRIIVIKDTEQNFYENLLPLKAINLIVTDRFFYNSSGKGYLITCESPAATVFTQKFGVIKKFKAFFSKSLCQSVREKNTAEYIKELGCNGVILAANTKPEIKEVSEIVIMFSGNWNKDFSLLTEDHNGDWSVLYYSETDGRDIKIHQELKETELRKVS